VLGHGKRQRKDRMGTRGIQRGVRRATTTGAGVPLDLLSAWGWAG